jgi:hypothetical protein
LSLPTVNDYFYSGNTGEFASAYKNNGVAFKLSPDNNNLPNFIPIYRYYNPTTQEHFYTTNAAEIGTTTPGKTGNAGYQYESVLGYISKDPLPNTQKLLRFSIPSQNWAHFYCLENSNDCKTALGDPNKYHAEGFLGYAYSP